MQKTVRLGSATLAAATMILAVGIFSHALACNYYASPSGGGNGLSQGSPFQIADFWSVASAGSTLCLLDGTYTGANSMIAPPSGKSGSSGNPITVRALNDGGAYINGQSSNKPLGTSSNSWFVIEGIDFGNSNSASAFGISNGSNNWVVRRVVVWNGQNSNNGTISIYNSSNTTFEDIAGFGTARNIFQLTQSANSFTVRRAWGMYEYDTSSTGPETVFEAMYNSGNNRFENVIGTAADSATWVNPYGLFFIGDEGSGHEILGSIFYVKSSSAFNPGQLIYHNANNGITIKDVVAYTAQPGKSPFGLGNPSGGTKILQNTTAIGGTGSTIGSNWTVANRVDANTVSQAPNIWNGSGTQGARVCKQYVNGTLTNTPLWPWPMDARIRAALITSGRNPDAIFGGTGNSVTQQMEQIFGAIPAECRTGGTVTPPPPPPPPPPTPVSGSLTSLKTLSPLTIDGSLNESVWSLANSVTFSNPTQSDNTVKVSTLWDDQNLYFAYDVTDSQLEALNDPATLWQDDGAEIYLDTQNNKSTAMDANDFAFLTNIDNVVSPSAITSRTITKTGGYTMEIKIPWASISTIPQANKILGLLLVNNDRDGGVPKQFEWMNVIGTGSNAQPNLWGSLILSGTTVSAGATPPVTPTGLVVK